MVPRTLDAPLACAGPKLLWRAAAEVGLDPPREMKRVRVVRGQMVRNTGEPGVRITITELFDAHHIARRRLDELPAK
jgi:hypothetical protein